jgi:Zn-dependent M16 (insulinase) family peptidase
MGKIYDLKRWVACILCLSFISLLLPTSVQASGETNFVVGQVYNGFKLTENKAVSDINSQALVFEHVKTGAKLLYLKNEDINKVFSISFYTPASDDTGVNHILEHSVLYGSEKYPVKSPLMEVMKTSVATYANAFTSYDKTAFPFASNNDKDFRNIMGIYMDAVFFPNFKKDSKIFDQEAWRYELDSKDGQLEYNGVVYNEMKGNYSSLNTTIANKIKKSLYPDTIYNWETGGDPSVMPTLTYEKALDTYNKNYHPSNSYIYLYGKLDILDTLKFLDEQYLSKFDKKAYDSNIVNQKSFDSRKTVTAEYALPKNADTKNKTYLTLNYAFDFNGNTEDLIGMQLLSDILVNSETSPFKNAIMKENLGSSFTASFMPALKQPYLSFKLDGSEEANKDKFAEKFDAALAGVVKNGLDKNYIKSVFNSLEMQLRASKTSGSAGINQLENVMYGWLYNNDVTKYLELDKSIQNIKKSIDSGYFEKLIQKYLIDNKHASLLVMKAKAGLEEEVNASAKKALEDYKAKLSDTKVNDLVEYTKNFKAWQNTPDSKEALATIPTLTLADIDTTSEAVSTVEKDINGIKVLEHPMYTNKITYSNMYFDSATVPQEKLPYLYLLSTLLGRVDTENYSFEDLYTKLVDLGGVSFSPTSIAKFGDSNVYYPKFIVSTAALSDRFDETLAITSEVMNKTKFDNKEELKKYIKATKANIDSAVSSMGDYFASSRLDEYISEKGKYDQVGILGFYNFISYLDANFDSNSEEIIKNLQEVSKLVFNKENLIVSITSDESEFKKAEDSLLSFSNGLNNNKLQKQVYNFDSSVKNEGLALPSNVQYVYQGANLKDLGYKYSGSMIVLGKILTTEYMMSEIREKGGAYGANFSVSANGNAVLSSYRDPNLKETFEAYKKAVDFLKNFNADDKKMTSYILGLVASSDNLSAPSQKGAAADNYYISGRTAEDDARITKEIVETKAKDIAAYADLISAILNKNTYVVAGNAEKLEANKELFTNIYNIIQSSETNKAEISVEEVKKLVQTANSTKLFADCNKAYGEILKLKQEDEQQSLLEALDKTYKESLTADVIQAINKLNEFIANPTVPQFNLTANFINTTVEKDGNKKYLLNEVTTWGYKLMFTPDVAAAIDAVNKIAVSPTEDTIKSAEDAISKVKLEGNKQWLTEQLNLLKASLKK